MTDQITNSGGTLTFERIIQFTISRSCDVALRPVPKRSAGEVLDTGSYVFHPMRIELVTRLTSNELSTLSNIHEANEAVTLTVGNCTYSNAWLEKPEIVYRHSFDGTNDRPYLTTLNLYAVNESCSGSFDGNFTHVLERNISKTHRVAINEFVNTNPTIDTNIWSEELERLELVARLTDAEKCGLNSNYWKQIVEINDGIWTYNGWMTNVEFEWDSTNYERPWLSTINFIILSKSSCPSGEQIINGGFETGDLTGWESDFASVWEGTAHSGSYHGEVEYDSCSGRKGWIKQSFTKSIPVDCVNSFSFWACGACSDTSYNDVRVYIYYDDNTTTTTNFNDLPWYPDGYTRCNIKSFLVSGKKVTGIKIEAAGHCTILLDDISLIC